MASKEDLKRQVCEAIERRADALIGLGETIEHQAHVFTVLRFAHKNHLDVR